MKVKELKFGDLRVPVERIWGFAIQNTVDQYVQKGKVPSVLGLSYLILRLENPVEDIEVCNSAQLCWQPTLNFLNKMREEYEQLDKR
jgi:hypothetical protein